MLSTLFYILAAPFALSPVTESDQAPTRPWLLHPNGDASKCLEVRGGVFADGTPVQMYVAIAMRLRVRVPFSDSSLFPGFFSHRFGNSFDCNNTPAQKWAISTQGETKVQVWETNFCLDAGSSEWRAQHYARDLLIKMFSPLRPIAPANGVGMKIWQCFDNLPAQDWFYTADNRVALTGTGALFYSPSWYTMFRFMSLVVSH